MLRRRLLEEPKRSLRNSRATATNAAACRGALRPTSPAPQRPGRSPSRPTAAVPSAASRRTPGSWDVRRRPSAQVWTCRWPCVQPATNHASPARTFARRSAMPTRRRCGSARRQHGKARPGSRLELGCKLRAVAVAAEDQNSLPGMGQHRRAGLRHHILVPLRLGGGERRSDEADFGGSERACKVEGRLREVQSLERRSS